MREVVSFREHGGINNAKQMFSRISKIDVDYSQENFLAFFLDSRKRVVASEVVFMGGLNECVVDARTIFRKAMAHNAAAIVVAHNHPSGSLQPSDEDVEVFEELKAAGKLLGIDVLDSIVFDPKRFHSMANAGSPHGDRKRNVWAGGRLMEDQEMDKRLDEGLCVYCGEHAAKPFEKCGVCEAERAEKHLDLKKELEELDYKTWREES